MASEINWSNLAEATRVIIRRQLVNSADDTLAEKLLNLVEELATVESLPPVSLLPLVSCIVNCCDSYGCDYDLGTLARLLGTLLQNERVFSGSNHEPAVQRAKSLIADKVAHLETLQQFTDQTGLIDCIRKVSSHASGNLWIMAQSELILPKLLQLSKESASYFVRSKSEKLIVHLISSNLDSPQVIHFMDEAIISSNYLSETNLALMSAVYQADPRNPFSNKLQEKMLLDFPLIFNERFDNLSVQIAFLKLFGALIEEDIVLAKIKQLINDGGGSFKLIMVLLSQLISRKVKRKDETIDILICLTSLGLGIEHESELLVNCQSVNYEKLNCDRSAELISLTVLSCDLLRSIDQTGMHLSLLHMTIEYVKKKLAGNSNSTKPINEAINCLGRICSQSEQAGLELITVSRDLLLVEKKSGSSNAHIFKMNLLKVYREILRRKLATQQRDQEIFIALNPVIIELINEKSVVRRFQPESEIEQTETFQLLDSLMEIITLLIKLDGNYLINYEDVFVKLIGLINLHKNEPQFKSSVVAILVAVNKLLAVETKPILTDFQSNHSDLLIVSLIDKEMHYRQPEFSLHLINELIEDIAWLNGHVIDSESDLKIVLHKLAKLIHYAIDNIELQSAAIKLVRLIISKREKRDLIEILFEVKLIDAIYSLLHSSTEDSPKLIDEANGLKRMITDLLTRESIAKDELLAMLSASGELNNETDQLKASDEPCVEISQRKEVIEDIFRGYVNQPTLDLINELNERDLRKTSVDPSVDHFDHLDPGVSLLQLVEMCFEETMVRSISERKLAKYSIIDDILAARETENKASMDCY